jgi:uncharacterized protein (DUF3084 family)
MKNDWTEQIERLTRELADAKSANEAMRDCADQRQAIINSHVKEIVEKDREILDLKLRLGRVDAAYRTLMRVANESRKMGAVKFN